MRIAILVFLAGAMSAQEPVRVNVAHPLAHDASHIEYAGIVEPARLIEVRAGVSSKAARVLAKVGARVRRGETIIELDRGPIEARVRQWEWAAATARAELALAQKKVDLAGQIAKFDAETIARNRTERMRQFQDLGARAKSSFQKLALENNYWRSQAEFRAAREILDQTLILCKSRPPGSDSYLLGLRLKEALRKIPTRPVPLDKACADELADLTDLLDRMLLLCRASTPLGRTALKAEVAYAEAVLKNAEEGLRQELSTLTQSTITSPMDGVVKQIIKSGETVFGGERSATLLATIAEVDVVRATFAVDEVCYLKYQQLIKLKDRPNVPIALARKEDKGFPFPGRIEFVDNQIDPRKNVGVVRALFDNARGGLTRAALATNEVRVRITLSEPRKVVLIPWHIVQTTREGGKQVLTVKDNRVEIRRIKLGGLIGNRQIVTEGLSPEDLVILGSSRRDGKADAITAADFATDVRNLRAGTAVDPTLTALPHLQ